jgi:hypothetical protein
MATAAPPANKAVIAEVTPIARECRHLFQPNIDGSDMNKRQESNGKLVISC